MIPTTAPIAIPLVTLSFPSNNWKRVLSYHFCLTTSSPSQLVSVGVLIHLDPASVTLHKEFSPHDVLSEYVSHDCLSTHFKFADSQTQFDGQRALVSYSLHFFWTTTFLEQVLAVASHAQKLLVFFCSQSVFFLKSVQLISTHWAPSPSLPSTVAVAFFQMHLASLLQTSSSILLPHGV